MAGNPTDYHLTWRHILPLLNSPVASANDSSPEVIR
jgi:hypothetical protein